MDSFRTLNFSSIGNSFLGVYNLFHIDFIHDKISETAAASYHTCAKMFVDFI